MKNSILIIIGLFVCSLSSWAQTTVTIGDGSGASYYEALTPYNTAYTDAQHQILFTKAELIAAGLGAGNITALAFNVVAADATTMNSFTISAQHTTQTTVSWKTTDWTECYSGNVTATVGWNTYVFTTSFNWNGTDNVMFKVCFDNPGSTASTSSTVYYTSNSGLHQAQYGNNESGCGYANAGHVAARPNAQITGAENLIPTLIVDPITIDLGYAESGNTSESQYVISGANLTAGPIVVTAPSGFGVSLTDGGPFTSSVDVTYTAPILSSTIVYVQFAPTAPETLYSDNITNVGGGDSKNVAVSGTSRLLDQYCASSVDYDNYTDITHVQFGSSLDNSTVCHSLTGTQGTASGVGSRYSNFTAIEATNIARGQRIPISVEINQCQGGTYAHAVKVYIDFNQNGDLADSGEEFVIWPLAESPTHTIYYDIAVPASATLGQTLLRVVDNYIGTFGPCTTGYGFGETEDYSVNIIDTPTTTTWNGSIDNDWGKASNWSLAVPTSSLDAIIPAGRTNYPTISSAANCKNITLEEGTTIVGQENLTASGTTKIEKSITAYSSNTDGWYAISAPVSGMAITDSDFQPVSDQDDFYAFDPATNTWLNYYGSNPATWFDEFDASTGYLAAYASANAGTKSFTGAFNSNTSYQLNLSNTGSSKWSLIGNPYPSKVTWADVSKNDVSSPKTINFSTGAWEEIGAELTVCQGIFVYAEPGTPSLTYELGDQTHGTSGKAADNISSVKLLAKFGELSVHMSLLANENASQAYDWKYDARYMYPFSGIPVLFALTSDDVGVSKYAFKPSDETCIVPLSFKVQEEQQITFEIEDYEKWSGIDKVTLEDTYQNTFTVLTEGKNYTFSASPNDDELRFKLLMESSTGISNPPSIDGLDIYSQNNMLYLTSTKLIALNVQVFNVTGQIVSQRRLLLDGMQHININANSGWYLVKVTSNEGVQSIKVFIP